jgi:hypothetical protein
VDLLGRDVGDLRFVWTPSVMMPAWAPVRETAFFPIALMAMAVRAIGGLLAGCQEHIHLTLCGTGCNRRASLIRLSVTPLMAETTQTT